jgi:hypothetical protein
VFSKFIHPSLEGDGSSIERRSSDVRSSRRVAGPEHHQTCSLCALPLSYTRNARQSWKCILMYLHIFASESCTFVAFEKTGRTNKTNDMDSTGQEARPASVASRFDILGPDSGEICADSWGTEKARPRTVFITFVTLSHYSNRTTTLKLRMIFVCTVQYSTAESDVLSFYTSIILGGSALGDRVDSDLPYRRDNERCPASPLLLSSRNTHTLTFATCTHLCAAPATRNLL